MWDPKDMRPIGSMHSADKRQRQKARKVVSAGRQEKSWEDQMGEVAMN